MPLKAGRIHRAFGILRKNELGRNTTGNILGVILRGILLSQFFGFFIRSRSC